MGHLFVKDEFEYKKKWFCLFTCLNVRAIHLELVEDMSTETFLLCFRRFIAKRVTPSSIISDNGSQLKLGYSVIKKIWNSVVQSEDVQSYSADKGISWKFITEYSPWQGGFYERLVGITKRSLRKDLGTAKVTRIELTTLITEIEAIVNSRPLTYVENEIDSGMSLTPAHFLSINHKTGSHDIELSYTPDQDTGDHLLEIWKKGQDYLKNFWRCWLSEYLPSLRERYNVVMKAIKREVDRKPKIGEIVIVKEEGLPSGRWKIARVKNLTKSVIDGFERAAKLQFPSGRISNRPLRLLYPLEYEEDNNDYVKDQIEDDNNDGHTNHGKDNNNVEEEIEENTNDEVIRRTSTRNAANAARSRIRRWCNNENEIAELGL